MNGFKGIQNTEGRAPGTPKKVTAKVRESFTFLLENNLSTLQSDLDSLKPIERLKILCELASFIIPKMKAIEVTALHEREKTKPIVIEWKSK